MCPECATVKPRAELDHARACAACDPAERRECAYCKIWIELAVFELTRQGDYYRICPPCREAVAAQGHHYDWQRPRVAGMPSVRRVLSAGGVW